MTIGERLAQLRARNHFTQSELARRAKIPVSTISMLEAGIRSGEGLSVGTARKLARALSVTMDFLCGVYDDDVEQLPAMAS
jgi:transcriptional regulator with XRE-family HTH domain